MEIVFRTPCTYHTDCDETSVGILHRSSKEGQPKPDEKLCMVCERVTIEAMKALRSVRRWKCPVCGFEHVNVNGEIQPAMSYWYNALSVTKKTDVR